MQALQVKHRPANGRCAVAVAAAGTYPPPTYTLRAQDCPECVVAMEAADAVITPARLRALRLCGEGGSRGERGADGASFADAMWPDSYGHHRSANCGPNDATQGAAMPMAGGALLSRMEREGLLARVYSSGFISLYVPSTRGKAILDREGREVPWCTPHDGTAGRSLPYPQSHLFTCSRCGEVAAYTGLER